MSDNAHDLFFHCTDIELCFKKDPRSIGDLTASPEFFENRRTTFWYLNILMNTGRGTGPMTPHVMGLCLVPHHERESDFIVSRSHKRN